MEEIVQAISQEYPCRRKFTEELFRYYGEDEESFVNSTFVFGLFENNIWYIFKNITIISLL